VSLSQLGSLDSLEALYQEGIYTFIPRCLDLLYSTHTHDVNVTCPLPNFDCGDGRVGEGTV
jgi:hypothetical protein